MEIGALDDGSSETFVLREVGSREELGRGGFRSFDPNDRFVSRRHVSLQLQPQQDAVEEEEEEEEEDANSSLVVRFEVIGRNPIWVFDHSSEEIQIFRRSEKGKLDAGDKFCLSSKRPVWLELKRVKVEEKTKSAMRSENDMFSGAFGEKDECVDDLECAVDVSGIDPIKEFGFLVLGHDFDKFPNRTACRVDKWNWFLEEPKGKGEEDDDEGSSNHKRKKGVGKSTRKKRGEDSDDDDDDDEEWKCERGDQDNGEEWRRERGDQQDNGARAKLRKVAGAIHSTGSMERGNSSKNNKHEVGTLPVDKEEDMDEDETLGGFIVVDEEAEEEVMMDEEEEEELMDEDEDEDEEEDEMIGSAS